MADTNDNKPKIFVDDDWKEQARKEKEEADRVSREQEAVEEIPEPSLAEVVQMIAIQATMALGGVKDPQTGQPIPPHMPLAKHYVDLLELLQTKTAGHTDEQEKMIIDGTLQELRMIFVQIANHLSSIAAAQEKKQVK
jgi:hypothetical protein